MTHDGHTYSFDLEYISDLNKKFPFKYFYEKKVFSSKIEYYSYLSEQKNNPNFLFDYAPQFKYQGSFEIEFKKSKKFPSPKAINAFLTTYIEKIVDKSEYRFSYILKGKNLKDRSRFTITLFGPKKLFESLEIKKLSNENWQPTIENGYFFYKE